MYYGRVRYLQKIPVLRHNLTVSRLVFFAYTPPDRDISVQYYTMCTIIISSTGQKTM